MNRSTGLMALVVTLAVAFVACTDGGIGPVEPQAPNLAKGGDPGPPGNGGGDIVNMDLTGSYSATDQSVSVKNKGKALSVLAKTEHPIDVTLDLPEIATSDFDSGTCWHNAAFSDDPVGDAAAAGFWNDRRTDGGPGRAFTAHVDQRNLGTPDGEHFNVVFWSEGGLIVTMRIGREDLYGDATWSETGVDQYTISGGGLSLEKQGSPNNSRVVCDPTQFGGGTTFTFQLSAP